MFYESQIEALTPHKINQRQKQIDLGKQSKEYWRYTQCISKRSRRREWALSWHPKSPDACRPCSTRSFTSSIREWRKRLHLWGNLTESEYKLLCVEPNQYPPFILEKKLTSNIDHKHTNSLNIPENINNLKMQVNLNVCQIPPYESNKKFLDTDKNQTTFKHTDRPDKSIDFNKSFLYKQTTNFANSIRPTMNHEEHLMTSLSVPPISDSAVIVSSTKTKQLLEGAKKSIKVSKIIAKRLLFFDPKHHTLPELSVITPMTNTLKYNKAYSSLPVAFLPKNFRGMQLWPSCNFLREEDLTECIHSTPIESWLQDIKQLTDKIPTILGSETHCKSIFSKQEKIDKKNNCALKLLSHSEKNIPLSDRIRSNTLDIFYSVHFPLSTEETNHLEPFLENERSEGIKQCTSSKDKSVPKTISLSLYKPSQYSSNRLQCATLRISQSSRRRF